MAEQAYAYVTLIPVAKGFQRAVADELSPLGGQGATAGKKFQSGFAGALKGLAAPIAAAFSGVAIGGFVKSAVGEASNLQESLNAVSVTFGRVSGEIEKLGQTSAAALGLSQNEFNGLAVQFSSFADKIAGPGGDVVGVIDDLTTRGADFASVMNLEVSDALGKFQAGLAGETEPLKRFGIDLSEATVKAFAYENGIAEVGATLTEQQKVQARYGSLMEQTAKTQGDFANTSDGLANSQRILTATFKDVQAEVGEALLPILAELTTAMIPLVEDLTPIFKQLLEALAPVISTVAENIGPLVKSLTPLVEAFTLILGVAGEIIAKVLPPLIQIFNAFTPIILALVRAFLPLIEAVLPPLISLIEKLVPVFKLVADFIGTFVVPIVELLAKILGVTLAVALKAINVAIEATTDFLKPFFDAMKPGIISMVTTAVQNLTKFLDPLFTALKPIVDALLAFAGIKPGDLKKDLVINTRVSGVNTSTLEGIIQASGGAKVLSASLANLPGPSTTIPTTQPGNKDNKAAETLKKQTDELRKVIQATRNAYKEARDDFFSAVLEANDKFTERTADIERDYSDTIADAEENFADRNAKVIERFNEQVIDAEERLGKARENAIKSSARAVANAQDRFAKQSAKIQKSYDQDVARANAVFAKRTADIQKTYDQAVSKANQAFVERGAQIQKSYQDSIVKANQARDLGLAQALNTYTQAVADINRNFAGRQADIIQQSMNRLRDAFRSVVQVNVADIFDSDQIAGSVKGLIVTLRDRLLGSRRLLENAAKLSAAGFSQTFIEQVVSAGPEVGNELAMGILESTPEMQAELRSLYGAIESDAETGMDALAKTIFEKNGLATSELKALYAQTETDLAESLAAQREIYEEAQAEIMARFNQSVAEAESARTIALAESQATLTAALSDAKARFDEANAEAYQDLTNSLAQSKAKFDESMAEAKVALDESLAEAKLKLDEELAEAQKAYDEAVKKAEETRDKGLLESQNALDKNILDAKKKRDRALEDAQEELNKALLKAQTDFLNDITKIEETFNAKVASMKGAAKALASEIANLQRALDMGTKAFSTKPTAVAGDGGLIPFAKGGLVTGPTNALIGEAGPEVVIPLDRFESMMGLSQGGPAVNYYAAPNQSLDSEEELFMAMKRAKVVVGW